ncbi:alpha/beta fold hydrolase [Tenacibaculum sp. nBUS_03]|uniref:alpha/beta fold hydrolase n=1 Tax=Tenacibaculum sp. nBUS_03 TaxID=3395320 RepID=UPI003EBEBF5E
MERVKKILKVVSITFCFLIIGIYALFVYFSSPYSDRDLLEKFDKFPQKPTIEYQKFKNFNYRTLKIIKDTSLPTLVFIHGTIGSCSNFIKYMSDDELLQKFNMIAYDRIGYNYNEKHHVQESISFEKSLVEDLIKNIPSEKIILVGYSYGGPIALAVKKKLNKIILIAPAVYSKVEPIPWVLNFYKWKLTRWLVPKIWKEASKEKISHIKDLQNFEQNWKSTTNNVTCIHGNADWIVPYSNSEFLQDQFPKEQFELITIQNAGHDLVWSEFPSIKQQLLNQSN